MSMSNADRPMNPADVEALAMAKKLLENPGLAAKITNVVGAPIEKAFDILPAGAAEIVHSATEKALMKAIAAAAATLGAELRAPSNRLHKLAVMATGAAGGAFGLPALVIELPVSTTVMLRSIADIARSEGEDLRTLEARLACLAVFALGGPSKKDDASESGYFAIRLALARLLAEAAESIAQRGLAQEGASAIARLVTAIASRFAPTVAEKAAAQMVPVVGALGGAALNYLFIDHFQDMARGHFVVRRLERTYGAELVRAQYEALSA